MESKEDEGITAPEIKRYAELKETIKYLPVDRLIEGGFYRILARNANVGVWLPQKEGFSIAREKFGEVYLFTEIHWDVNEFYGTVKPIFRLEDEKLPKINSSDLDSPEELSSLLRVLGELDQYWSIRRLLKEQEGGIECPFFPYLVAKS